MSVTAYAGLPGPLQAEMALMSPSLVDASRHADLALVLLEGLVGETDESGRLSQAARRPALAALCQIVTSEADVSERIVLGLSKVCCA